MSDLPPAGGEVFSPRIVLGLVLTGVLAFCAYVALSAYAPDLRSGHNGGGHALSSSAVGYGGVVDLMRLTGRDVRINRRPALRKSFRGLLVVTPERPLAPDDLPAHNGDRLIVLPKWSTAPDAQHPGWVVALGLEPTPNLDQFAPSQLGKITIARRRGVTEDVRLFSSFDGWTLAGLPLGPIDGLQTISGPDLIPLVFDESGAAVLAAKRGTRTFVLADPDLINTQGVADLSTSRIALLMMDGLHDKGAPVAFDVTLNGFASSQNLVKFALEPPFLGTTLALLAAAALIGLQAWSRFGPAEHPSRRIAAGKTSLVENGASMIRLARREPRMALRYVRLSREHAVKSLGAVDLAEAEQNAFLDRWADRLGARERITALIDGAERVKSAENLVLLAQRTRQWRQEMTHEAG